MRSCVQRSPSLYQLLHDAKHVQVPNGASGGATCSSRWRPVITSSLALDLCAPHGSTRKSFGISLSRVQPSLSASRHSLVFFFVKKNLVSQCNVCSNTWSKTQREPTSTMICPRHVAPVVEHRHWVPSISNHLTKSCIARCHHVSLEEPLRQLLVLGFPPQVSRRYRLRRRHRILCGVPPVLFCS